MTATVEIPLWLFLLIIAFAAVTFASHFLFPSVRWVFRRRAERVVARLNERLERPIQPFKLARRHDMIQRLLYHPSVTEAIVEHAARHGVPENVAFETARRYAREIVPSFSAFTYFALATRISGWLSRSLYDVRMGQGREALAAIDPEATLVYVINHRSNMDYVLVTHLAANQSALSYAVGEWARVWPLRSLIRAMGAYFIRRTADGRLYRRVLARYVHMATEAGVTQAVFPEGGLSLDGRLAPPRLGLLSYIAAAGQETGRDVVFVPVGIAYDRVFEDRVLVAASQSGERRFPARISVVAGFMARQLWLRLRGRYRRHGIAAVGFGAPLSLRAATADGQADPEALAQTLMTRIAAAIPALPVPLVSAALLQSDGAIGADRIAQRIQPRLDGHPFLPGQADAVVEEGLALMRQRHLVSETEDGIAPAEGERPLLQYYANGLPADALAPPAAGRMQADKAAT